MSLLDTQNIVRLIKVTSSDLQLGVESNLKQGLANEEMGTAAHLALESVLQNIELARKKCCPMCQDTGTPIFHVYYPPEYSPLTLTKEIRAAVAEATRLGYLRPNAVDALTGENSGDNLGDEYFPLIQFQPVETGQLSIELMLKGGGCENVGAQYSLPDIHLNAERDLEGVRKVALHAVQNAQGFGCAPGVLGIAIGGDRATGYLASKKALLRPWGERNPNPQLAALEERITTEANQLGIGPMGFGGRTTLLGTRIVSTYRIPASYFVSVSYMCWAYRKRTLVIRDGEVIIQ